MGQTDRGKANDGGIQTHFVAGRQRLTCTEDVRFSDEKAQKQTKEDNLLRNTIKNYF